MGIIVFLAIVSSPVFALSKADIIASWATPEPAPTYDNDIPSCGDCSPKPTLYPSMEDAKERQSWRDSIWAEHNPFYLEKNIPEFQRPEIIDYGPAPSSHMTVAEFLNWGSIGGVPESWYTIRANISHTSVYDRLSKIPGGIL